MLIAILCTPSRHFKCKNERFPTEFPNQNLTTSEISRTCFYIMWFGPPPLKWKRNKRRITNLLKKPSKSPVVIKSLPTLVDPEPPPPEKPLHLTVQPQVQSWSGEDAKEVRVGIVCECLKYLITGSNDCVLRVWRLDEMKTAIQALRFHAKPITQLAICPKWLASSDESGTIVISKVTAVKFSFHRFLKGHTASITALKFTPDTNPMLITSSEDHTLRLWDPDTGACRRTMASHTSRVTCFLLLGLKLCSGSSDRTVCVWNLLAPQYADCDRVFQHHTGTIHVLVHCGGSRFLTACNDTKIRTFDARGNGCLRIYHGHQAAVYSLMYLATQRRILSGNGHGNVLIHDFETGNVLEQLDLHKYWIEKLEFGTSFVACSSENFIAFWLKEKSWNQPTIQRVVSQHQVIHQILWISNTQVIVLGDAPRLEQWQLN